MYVFVYGTLKQGLSNHHFLRTSEFIGSATLQGYQLHAVTPSYPGIVPATRGRNSIVCGEIYRVDTACMRRLDRLEDNGRMYLRQELPITLNDGSVVTAWVYLWNLPIIPSMTAIDGSVWIPKRS